MILRLSDLQLKGKAIENFGGTGGRDKEEGESLPSEICILGRAICCKDYFLKGFLRKIFNQLFSAYRFYS